MDVTYGLPQGALGLLVALVIGMLIGLERGWRDRSLPQGGRAAGLRTFTLTGLLGGILASLPEDIRVWSISAGLMSIAAFMTIAYWRGTANGNQSMTSAITLLLTFALGAYAAIGEPMTALGLAVIAALLLNLKATLHGWLRKIEPQELSAGLQLLVLSVVILPNLPDANLGPYGALNPYKLWWAVILIAGLSMAGHVAMRAFGARRGVLWTGMLGGLASSTATTLALARLVRQNPALTRTAAIGALSATGMMAMRLLVILFVIQHDLFVVMLPYLLAPATVLFSVFLWECRRPAVPASQVNLPRRIRPYSLQTALGFGLFLAVIGVAVPLVEGWIGREGIYAVAALSGVADVDAITVSLAAALGSTAVTINSACLGIAIAVVTNLLSKAVMTAVAGSMALALRVALGYLAALLACSLVWFI